MPVYFFIDFLSTYCPVSLPLAFTLLLITVTYFVRNRGLPPGPIGLPYFGYWPFMKNSNAHFKLDGLKKKYGDIFCFGCTGRLYINLGSYKAIREALVTKSECFGERMSGYHLFGHVFKGGVIYINGEAWRVARKFFLVNMKERGANSLKTSIAGPLYDSIQCSVNELKARNGEPLNLIEFCTHRCNTFLRLTMFGAMGATAEQIIKFNELYSVAVQCITPTNMLLCGTFAKYFIFPFTPYYNETVKCNEQMEKLVYDIINEHKATYDAENPRNIIDEYFKERDKRRSKGDPTAEYFADEILMGTLSQFMGDGVLIVSSFTCLLMKNFLLHPEEQEKLYEEITEVVGVQRLPTIEDKSKLTYFNAYVLESMRTSDFFTFFPSQECIKETTLKLFKIPKRTIVIENFSRVIMIPKCMTDKKFNPSVHTNGWKEKSRSTNFVWNR
ncbi:Cytochrome P450 2B12 [Araneus ventricosus]|uniref:Cytochrome P450 2B12 n=1 Tax=Araneus ventricosus TaxID=182803 RepID=A0A4Y2IJV6_ARAVE|nr:Cytochrome P450 2B12 [Araneus ventricosus]